MKLEEIKNINRLYIYKGSKVIGILRRTDNGSRFSYNYNMSEDEKLSEILLKELGAICFTMPIQKEEFETVGDNLHPFFAGLLPEGIRLESLIHKIKTSPDDMFSLFASIGIGTIGDIWAYHEKLPENIVQNKFLNQTKSINPEESSFEKLLEENLNYKNYQEIKNDISIAGVQPKISAQRLAIPVSLAKKNKHYILKLANSKFPQLIENEHFFMTLASKCLATVARTKIITDMDGEKGLLIERFDRKSTNKIHQEDACQFLSKYPHQKYRLSMREISEGVKRYSTSPIIDILRLIEIKIFSYLIANGDLHAKNISLTGEPGKEVRLSPAYDLLSTLAYGDQTMALGLEGRNSKLRQKDFIIWGERFGVRESAIKSSIKKISDSILKAIEGIEEIGFNSKKEKFLKDTIKQRIKDLS